jgi:signal transduction histidine kinase
MNLLQRLVSTDEFMPHGMCYEWNPAVSWLQVVSDAVIAFAYYSIPITLIYFVRKRRDLAFDWMFLCFAFFIVACGTTHVMEIFNIWHPTYWLSGVIKAITALISIVTSLFLIKLVPKALALPSPAQLRKTNEALQSEIEDRMRASKRIELLNQELLLQSSNIQTTNKELESFAYSVSHDLRAPLRHIDGYANLLLEATSSLGEEGARYLRKISDSSKQMGLLIDNLLAFSRMGRTEMHRAWTDSEKLIEEVREELAPEMEGRTIDWKIETLPQVYVDKILFKQVWMNLLGNAIKYSRNRERTEITIGCRENESEFEFYIKDNGAGFDMQYRDKLFGIFQRLHMKEEFEGTGIGLANAQRIIVRHGGRIWAHGEVEVGATFYFTLLKSDFNK